MQISLRFVLNTRSDEMVSRVCIHELQERLSKAGVHAVKNDWDHYENYDVAIFPGWDHEMEKARRQNGAISVGLADPKQSSADWVASARTADFLMVSSLEQRDALLRLNRNILIHYMFPRLPSQERRHRESSEIVVGYHGNRVHLECMKGGVQLALEELGRHRSVELVMVYNIAANGRATIGLPNPSLVRHRHVQWTPESYTGVLASVDIGIVPATLPIRDRQAALEATAFSEPEFCYEPFDYLIRYKASTNPGRILPFARFGVPVVADATPSACEFIEDGVSGRLALSAEGWFVALEELAASASERARLASNLRAKVEIAYERQVPRLLQFCASLPPRQPVVVPGAPKAEDELQALRHFEKPRGPGLLSRLSRRLRSRRD